MYCLRVFSQIVEETGLDSEEIQEKFRTNSYDSVALGEFKTDTEEKSILDFTRNYRTRVSGVGAVDEMSQQKDPGENQRELNKIFKEFLKRVGPEIIKLRAELFDEFWYFEKRSHILSSVFAYFHGFLKGHSLWESLWERVKMARVYSDSTNVAAVFVRDYQTMHQLLLEIILPKNVYLPKTYGEMEKYLLGKFREIMLKAHCTPAKKKEAKDNPDMPLDKLIENVLPVRESVSQTDLIELKSLFMSFASSENIRSRNL